MAIYRSDTLAYAARYWDRPCDDGLIYLSDGAISVERKRRELGAPASDGWEARFVNDGNGAEKAVFERIVRGRREEKLIQPWEGLADCAHFLSRCLRAGGVNITVHTGVTGLIRDLQGRLDTKVLGIKVSRDRGQKIVNSGIIKEGDVIGYFNIDPQGDYGAIRYTHSTIFAGGGAPGRITCHTKSRFPRRSSYPDQWYLDTGYTYTFIHFSNDDPRPGRATVALLHGWWKVEYGNQTEYYRILGNGHVGYTLTAPRAEHNAITREEGTGYWFEIGGKIIFCWRKSGMIEEWTKGSHGSDFNVLVESVNGKAAKLFQHNP